MEGKGLAPNADSSDIIHGALGAGFTGFTRDIVGGEVSLSGVGHCVVLSSVNAVAK